MKTVLVVGASRGLGLGLAKGYLERGWRVIATQRGSGSKELEALQVSYSDTLRVEALDMTDAAGIAALRQRLAAEMLDLLFVSGGVNIDSTQPVGAVSLADFDWLMRTNTLAPLMIIESLIDRVKPTGMIAAMSSLLGSVTANTTGGFEVYRASKAGLNTLLRSFSTRHPERTIVAMSPGWVRTEMGGQSAAISVDESVTGMIAVLAGQVGKPGCVFLNYTGASIPW